MEGLRYSLDASGTPGVCAPGEVGALYGLGVLHGRHRPLQSLLLGNVGMGRLSSLLLPVPDLVGLDAIAHRLELPALGAMEAERLSSFARDRLNAYLLGLQEGLHERGRPLELKLLCARLPTPDIPALLSGFVLSAYLGLAEGQERMERAIVACVQAGAEPGTLESLFAPHLNGWVPNELLAVSKQVPLGFAAPRALGGSNAFAVAPEKSQSGRALLAGDPHLQINQLPALFFETRLSWGDGEYLLGASIPGLPAIAVGRSRHLAWSGTFAVADNVDHFVERLEAGHVISAAGAREALGRRQVLIPRRGLWPKRVDFAHSARGAIAGPVQDGLALSVAWAGRERVAETIDRYLRLPQMKSAVEAQALLQGASSLSLHFVLADRSGDLRYTQAGRIPRRSPTWSGLYPAPAAGQLGWVGRYQPGELPNTGSDGGFLVSANEARPAPDGGVLSTLAQPGYRRVRIRKLLERRSDHDLASLGAIQRDLHSYQAERLLPVLLAALPAGPMFQALSTWDRGCQASSRGAHAFAVAYRAALHALAPELGGAWWHQMLAHSELSVWWCAALDRMLGDKARWPAGFGARLADALDGVARVEPEPWGTVQQLTLDHLLFGSAYGARGPFALEGSIASVCQGNLLQLDRRTVAVGPAYRFLTDLGEDWALSSLPGGIDGDPRHESYACWLDDHLAGRLHRIAPPASDAPT